MSPPNSTKAATANVRIDWTLDGYWEKACGQPRIPAAEGYGLTTAEIHYHVPDYPRLLQLYVWQEYDLAPEFPTLKGFLDYWERDLEGALHSVRVAHHRLIKPSEWQAASGVFTIQ